jgi:hypothetical protein
MLRFIQRSFVFSLVHFTTVTDSDDSDTGTENPGPAVTKHRQSISSSSTFLPGSPGPPARTKFPTFGFSVVLSLSTHLQAASVSESQSGPWP